MEDNDRKTIRKNIIRLVETTEFNHLIEKLEQYGIFSRQMIETIRNANENDYEKHIRLFENITRRGPDTFEKLQQICRTHFPDAFQVLQQRFNDNRTVADSRPMAGSSQTCHSDISSNDAIPTDNTHLTLFSGETNNPLQLEVIKSNRIQTQTSIRLYSMESKNRGVLFLVNNIKFSDGDIRRGAEYDRDNLITLFRAFGFTIFYHENVTAKEFINLIEELICSTALQVTDCLVLTLLSYGNCKDGKTTVDFIDGKCVDIEKAIIAKFNNSNCPTLCGKPKLLIFSGCRRNSPGKYCIEEEYQATDNQTRTHRGKEVSSEMNIPTFTEIIICHATFPYFLSYCEPHYGTWFIQKLCTVFAAYAHEEAFSELMKRVAREMQLLQKIKPNLKFHRIDNRGVGKKLYFNPGCC